MDLYTKSAYQISELLTKNYSTSFSLSTQLFDKKIQPHIYAIYGLVRIADEIVDTYRGSDMGSRLDDLYASTIDALNTGYSTNPIIHAFVTTANEFHIDQSLISPFFESMRMDIAEKQFSQKTYKRYIYGSAEVVGLMCLRVFVHDEAAYKSLSAGAQALGSAYQKINFLRDIRADYEELGRVYFPGLDHEKFTDKQKQNIIKDIKADLKIATKSIVALPSEARQAITASFVYYQALLKLLEQASVADIKQRRLRVSNAQKIYLYIKVRLGVTSLRSM